MKQEEVQDGLEGGELSTQMRGKVSKANRQTDDDRVDRQVDRQV